MRPLAKKKYHTITEIVGTVYCEQKVIFDRDRGNVRPLAIRAKAAGGTFEHLRFQIEGQTRTAMDRRCFIATEIYGPDAPETNFLRSWRDRTLMPTKAGRFLVRAYYATSPCLVPVLARSKEAASAIRAALNVLLAMLGMPR